MVKVDMEQSTLSIGELAICTLVKGVTDETGKPGIRLDVAVDPREARELERVYGLQEGQGFDILHHIMSKVFHQHLQASIDFVKKELAATEENEEEMF